VLGLAPGAALVELKRAYRKRALETHPDQGGDAEAFQAVQRAYEKLTAPVKRRRGSGP
jgi:molecular chaperone DnaJ